LHNQSRENVKVTVTFDGGSSAHDRPSFYIVQTVRSPSGARLIAVKSDKPFDYISIEANDLTPHAGFAIANIRYWLIKGRRSYFQVILIAFNFALFVKLS
jgi:hypothetical protein